MRAAGAVLVALLACAPALAQGPGVTHRIAAPYIPEGYVLELTEDCRIVGGREAPSAIRECAPGLGWRLAAADGKAVFPKDRYLPPDANWAFPGPRTGVFLSGGQIEIVSLETGDVRLADFNRLEQVRMAEGLSTLAVTWKGRRPEGDVPVPARLVGPDGAVGEALPGSDMRGVEGARGYTDCWNAVILSAISVERLPNSVWTELSRAVGEAGGALACGPYLVPALAGRDEGGWRLLDPGTLRPASERVFASAGEALASARGD